MLKCNAMHPAVTRGRRLAVVVGQPKALAIAVRGARGRGGGRAGMMRPGRAPSSTPGPAAATGSPPQRGRWAGLLGDGRVLYLLPVLALPVPLLVNDYVQYVINLGLVYVLVGVGFNIVIGNLGQLAFANAAFFGIGAYATGVLMHHLAVPFWIAFLGGGLAGAVAGAVVALPALRGIRLFYLAIITLAFGELMRWVYIHAEAVTLGSMGLHVPQPTVFGLVLATETHKFYVFLAVVTLLVAATANLLRSRIGRAFMAIRDNELAAASMGIPTARYFVLAFAWSGFVVGVGGALYAALVRLVAPEAFNLLQLILHFAIVLNYGEKIAEGTPAEIRQNREVLEAYLGHG